MEKVKPIVLKMYEEDGSLKETYTLEFNRASVVFAEQRGFTIKDLEEKGMTRIPELFFYAFRMHHPRMTKQETDKILFEQLGGLTEEVLERLLYLWNAPFETLVIDDEESEGKNSRAEILL